MSIVLVAACQTTKHEDTGSEPYEDPPTETADTGTTRPPTDPDNDQDGFPGTADCDDTNPNVYPGAPDVCGDDTVTDCDRASDDGLVTVDGSATFTSLTDALAAATAGSEVLVCPGTYSGSFDVSAPLTVRSHAGRDATTLSGAAAGRVLQVAGGTTLIGLTLTDGAVPGEGGGVRIASPGTVTLDDCVVEANKAQVGGGVFVPEDAELVLIGSEIRNNQALEGGGGIAAFDATLDLGDSVVSGNVAIYGAGVFMVEGDLSGGQIAGNLGEATPGGYYYDYFDPYGGGLYAIGTVTVTGTSIAANEASYGAGVYATSGSLVLTDAEITDNDTGAAGYGLGGGLYAVLADVQLMGTTEIHTNYAGTYGGGVFLATAALTGGVVRDNTSGYAGGGLYLANAALSDATVSGNTAVQGGGVWVAGSGAEIVATTIESNTATSVGGGVYTLPSSDTYTYTTYAAIVTGTIGTTDTDTGYSYDGALTLTDTLVVSNTADDEGGGIFGGLPLTVIGGSLTDNVALGVGGGLYQDSEVATLVDTVVVRNNGANGGGAAIGLEGRVSSVSTDWGADADDNDPDDLWLGNTGVTGYGADETFDCTKNGCSPMP